jgi:hypothetical protein
VDTRLAEEERSEHMEEAERGLVLMWIEWRMREVKVVWWREVLEAVVVDSVGVE